MISFLQGVLAAKHPDRVEVDVNGVGYEVFVTPRTLRSLPAPGGTVLLKTHLHVREDLLQVFGFRNDMEKEAFLLALSVSGIGPKAALAILTVLSPEEFHQAVLHNDLASLRSVPGIGSKTAQHLVLELKEKVAKKVGKFPELEEGAYPAGSRNVSDALQALMALGYTAAESRKAVLGSLQALGGNSTVEEIVKSSLKSIASR